MNYPVRKKGRSSEFRVTSALIFNSRSEQKNSKDQAGRETRTSVLIEICQSEDFSEGERQKIERDWRYDISRLGRYVSNLRSNRFKAMCIYPGSGVRSQFEDAHHSNLYEPSPVQMVMLQLPGFELTMLSFQDKLRLWYVDTKQTS